MFTGLRRNTVWLVALCGLVVTARAQASTLGLAAFATTTVPWEDSVSGFAGPLNAAAVGPNSRANVRADYGELRGFALATLGPYGASGRSAWGDYFTVIAPALAMNTAVDFTLTIDLHGSVEASASWDGGDQGSASAAGSLTSYVGTGQGLSDIVDIPRLDTTRTVTFYGGATSSTAAPFQATVTLLVGRRYYIGQDLRVSASVSGNSVSGSAAANFLNTAHLYLDPVMAGYSVLGDRGQTLGSPAAAVAEPALLWLVGAGLLATRRRLRRARDREC